MQEKKSEGTEQALEPDLDMAGLLDYQTGDFK